MHLGPLDATVARTVMARKKSRHPYDTNIQKARRADDRCMITDQLKTLIFFATTRPGCNLHLVKRGRKLRPDLDVDAGAHGVPVRLWR